MKRFFIALMAVCTIGISASHAQEMKKGTSLFNVGLGFFPGVGVNVSYDYGLVNNWGPGIFTVGGYVGFANWGKTYTGNLDYRVNSFAFSPRATYRYSINKSFEVYGAAMLGAVVYSYSKYVNNESKVFVATTAGCRYSFSRNMAVFAEVGYNELSYVNGGLSFLF